MNVKLASRQSGLGVEESKGDNASFYRRALPAQTIEEIDQHKDRESLSIRFRIRTRNKLARASDIGSMPAARQIDGLLWCSLVEPPLMATTRREVPDKAGRQCAGLGITSYGIITR
ncbi:hypothetical protein V6000_003959 [Aspergillus fumigatus]